MTLIGLKPEKVELVTMACCTLHNFLRSRVEASAVYIPPGSIHSEDPTTHELRLGDWQSEQQTTGLTPLGRQGSNHCSTAAKELRDQLCHYFNSAEGQVEWQWDIV